MESDSLYSDSVPESSRPQYGLNETRNNPSLMSSTRIAEWPRSIESLEPDADIVSVVYSACVKAFIAEFRIMRNSSNNSASSALGSLQEEFRKFYVWNDTISCSLGDLGSTLLLCRNLRYIVLSLLVQWSRALCRVPLVLSDCDWTMAHEDLTNLEAIASKADEIVESLRRVGGQIVLDDEQQIDGEIDSDSSSVQSMGGLSDILEEMNACTESLVDLLPSLENPAEDRLLLPKATQRQPPTEVVSGVRIPNARHRVHLLSSLENPAEDRLLLPKAIQRQPPTEVVSDARIPNARHRMLHASNTIRNTIEKGNTYCYKNIDYDNEIRVLKVYPGLAGSAIICCLLPCPLVDQTLQPALPSSIPYAALSYCWGSDEAVNKIYFVETDKVYTEWKGPNKNALDGMVGTKMVSCLLVGSSLKDALETLRSRSKEPVFLWADAICINQKNLAEKSAQVSRMHDVYTQAETVYIWLGTGKDEGKAEDPRKGKDDAKLDDTSKDQDEKNRKTLAFLTKILDLHELEMVVKRLEEREANANWLEDKQDCKRTIELMGAQWFSRRWVIQELALARSASVLFGNCEMPWRDFADAIALFMTKFDQIKAAFPAPKNYAALRTSEDRYINSLDAKALGANVLITATSNLFRKSSSGRIIQRLLSLELLVSSMLLTFEATDPRDTVFAVLHIAKDISPRNFSRHRHSIIFRRSAAEAFSYTVPILGIILWTLYDNSLTLTGDYKGPTTDIALTNMARGSLPVFVFYCTLLSLSMFIVWLLGRMLIKPIVNGFQGHKALDKRIEPNYLKSVKDVYAGFIEYCIENSNSLDIICRHWAPFPKPPAKVDMPSWILPISGNAFGGPAQAKKGRVHGDSFVGSEKGGFYTASGSRTPIFKFGKTKTARKPIADEKMEKSGEFSKRDVQQREFPARFDGTLKVKGFQLSEVEQSERIIGPVISREALKLCGWSKNRGASEADLDQVWRILVANRGPNGINPPDWYRRACSACLEWYNRLDEDKFNIDDLKTMEDTPKGKVEFLERVRQVVFDRSIIRAGSSQGKSYLGVAPPQAQRGDVVCILFGCSVPVILSRQKDGGYKFIGECYIHGAMDGEVAEPQAVGATEQWFNLC